MFTLAHLSDPHIGPLPRAQIRELAGKRVLGWLNWNRGRRDTHRMDVLDQLLVDMHAQSPDHIALTGDVVNLALPGEYPAARAFLERVGSPEQLSLVPGNHDAYTKGGAIRLLSEFDPWMRGDGSGAHPLDEMERFPYVRIRGKVALVGLSSAVPTAPFMATGKLGVRQVTKLRAALEHLGKEGLCRVVMLHHPGAPPGCRADGDADRRRPPHGRAAPDRRRARPPRPHPYRPRPPHEGPQRPDPGRVHAIRVSGPGAGALASLLQPPRH